MTVRRGRISETEAKNVHDPLDDVTARTQNNHGAEQRAIVCQRHNEDRAVWEFVGGHQGAEFALAVQLVRLVGGEVDGADAGDGGADDAEADGDLDFVLEDVVEGEVRHGGATAETEGLTGAVLVNFFGRRPACGCGCC